MAFAFAFAFIFELGRFAFAFMFELAAGVLGGAMVGAGVAVLVRFALLLLALFDVASPQPTPRAPIARTVASAIFFILLNSSPVFLKD